MFMVKTSPLPFVAYAVAIGPVIVSVTPLGTPIGLDLVMVQSGNFLVGHVVMFLANILISAACRKSPVLTS